MQTGEPATAQSAIIRSPVFVVSAADRHSA